MDGCRAAWWWVVLCLRVFSPGTPPTVRRHAVSGVGLIGDSTLPIGVNEKDMQKKMDGIKKKSFLILNQLDSQF